MTEKQSARHPFALFDSLRGLAVLSVIGFHVASLTGRLSEGPFGRVMFVLGGEAVIVFFVISGFLLYRPFVAARAAGRPLPRTGAFLFRRAFRIVPAYWVILTLLAIYPGLHGPFTEDWWRYYFFLQLYSPDTVLAGLPVAWTLCVEVTFYLLLPLWALGVRRLRPAGGHEGGARPERGARGRAAAPRAGCGRSWSPSALPRPAASCFRSSPRGRWSARPWPTRCSGSSRGWPWAWRWRWRASWCATASASRGGRPSSSAAAASSGWSAAPPWPVWPPSPRPACSGCWPRSRPCVR